MGFGKGYFDWEVKSAYVVSWSWIHFFVDFFFDSHMVVAGRPHLKWPAPRPKIEKG